MNNNNKANNNNVRAFSEYLERTTKEDDMIPLEDVLEAYYECRRNKRRTINALQFEVNYEDNCVRLWRDINNRTYTIGKSIAFIVTRPKPREVFAADFRDRVVHHLVAKRLEALFEGLFIEDTYNCRKGKGTLYGVHRLEEVIRKVSDNYAIDCYVGKFDIQGFFMSIHKPTLNSMLQKFIDEQYANNDKDILKWIVHKIVMHSPEKNCVRKSPLSMWNLIDDNKSLFKNGEDYGLAIGNLTSQMFANFYLNEFDTYMTSMYDGYGRYVDDFFVVDRNKTKILNGISKSATFLKEHLGIKLHPKKMYLQHYTKGVKFTGAVIKPHRSYIGNRTVANFYGKIHYFNHIAEDNMDILPYVETFVNSINSYLGFLKHHKSWNIRRRTLRQVSPKWRKFVMVTPDKVAKMKNTSKQK